MHAETLQPLQILAVDDHTINCELIQAAIGPRVDSLMIARNGRQAIELCLEHPFDLVLMDLHMPDRDGISTWEMIVEQVETERLPYVIALTAENRPEELARMRAAGFNGYLHKPVAIDLLVETIARVAQGQSGFSHLEDEECSRSKLLDNERAIAVNGNPELALTMRKALAADLLERRPVLDQFIAQGEYEQAAQLVHQWAGGAGYAGANRLQHACRAFERCLRNDLDSSPGTHFLEVLRRLDCTVAAIQFNQPIRS